MRISRNPCAGVSPKREDTGEYWYLCIQIPQGFFYFNTKFNR